MCWLTPEELSGSEVPRKTLQESLTKPLCPLLLSHQLYIAMEANALSSFLEDLLAGRRVRMIHDQCRTSKRKQAAKQVTTSDPRNRRRSIDMICRFKDKSPSPPSRRGSLELNFAKVSSQPPRMPTRQRSFGHTPAAMPKVSIPSMEQSLIQLMAPPVACQ